MSASEVEQEVAILTTTNNKLLDKIEAQRDTIQNKQTQFDKLTAQLDRMNMEMVLLKNVIAARNLSENSAKRSR